MHSFYLSNKNDIINAFKEVLNMICPNCKHEINDNSKVCPVCGAYLQGEFYPTVNVADRYYITFATLGFIFGIASIAVSFFAFLFVVGVIALSFTIIAGKSQNELIKARARKGRILAIIGIVINVFFTSFSLVLNYIMPLIDMAKNR